MSKISIILPVYNGANFLRESIQSVINQSFYDFDLHILDDFSNDDSPKIAKEFACIDKRVRYTRNSEKYGLYKTLNRGCMEAESNWIRLWAHDDKMTPNSLQTFYDFTICNPDIGMVYCNFYDMNNEGELTGNEEAFRFQRERTPKISYSNNSALLLLAFGCLPGNISTCMLNKYAWNRVGRFQEGIQQSPDYHIWTKISENYPMGYINEKIVELRAHSLQLGRLGHKLLTTIDEAKDIYDILYQRLVPEFITESEFRSHWRKCQGLLHMHTVMKTILKGDFKLARKGVYSISKYNMLLSQFVTWLFSMNGRILNEQPHEFYDRVKSRIKVNT